MVYRDLDFHGAVGGFGQVLQSQSSTFGREDDGVTVEVFDFGIVQEQCATFYGVQDVYDLHSAITIACIPLCHHEHRDRTVLHSIFLG